MTKIGLVGGKRGSVNWHGIAFSAILSKKDNDAWERGGFAYREVEPFDDTTVVAVYDEDEEAAKTLASMLPDAEVVRDPGEMVGRVDGVVIVDDVTQQHQKQAAPFLRARVPTFVDKPLSRETGEAAHIIRTAEQHGTPFMSGSALRYARELEDVRDQIREIGPIRYATAIGPGELVFYGVHPTELFHSALGPGVDSVNNLGEPGNAFVAVQYAEGPRVLLAVSENIAYTFQLSLHGANGHIRVEVADHHAFYRNLMEAAVRMFRTGEPPIPASSTLEVIKILHGSTRSLEIGGPVYLSDL